MATLKQEIQKAIKGMLIQYTDCPADRILSAYNNKVPLPKDNNYIIITVMNPERLGTPIVEHNLNGDTSFQDYKLTVQIDFYGQFAFDRANDIINISRTPFLCDFLKNYGVQPIACDESMNLTGISGEKEYVDRYMVRLEIDYRDAVIVNQDGFNTAKLNIFETEF